jgi:hypothetical protein
MQSHLMQNIHPERQLIQPIYAQNISKLYRRWVVSSVGPAAASAVPSAAD